jgi:hypothetical protein
MVCGVCDAKHNIIHFSRDFELNAPTFPSMESTPAPTPFFTRIFGYLGLALAETVLSFALSILVMTITGIGAVSQYVHSLKDLGAIVLCASVGTVVLSVVAYSLIIGLFVAAKVVYFFIPARMRWINLVFYATGIAVWTAGMLSDGMDHDARGSNAPIAAITIGLCALGAIPFLVLIASYYLVLPNFDPKRSARDYLLLRPKLT